jgi:hypothetical protein
MNKGSPVIIQNRINPFFILTHNSLRSFLILPSRLFLGILIGLFPVELSVKILKAYLHLTQIFGPKKDENGEWRRLHDQSEWKRRGVLSKS